MHPIFLRFFCFRDAVVCACMCVYSEISLIEVEVGKKGTAKKRMVFVLFFGGVPPPPPIHLHSP